MSCATEEKYGKDNKSRNVLIQVKKMLCLLRRSLLHDGTYKNVGKDGIDMDDENRERINFLYVAQGSLGMFALVQ